jgi:hypothetical protein
MLSILIRIGNGPSMAYALFLRCVLINCGRLWHGGFMALMDINDLGYSLERLGLKWGAVKQINRFSTFKFGRISARCKTT